MKKGQRPSKHIRRVRTKKGRRKVVVNRKIKKRSKKRIIKNYGGMQRGIRPPRKFERDWLENRGYPELREKNNPRIFSSDPDVDEMDILQDRRERASIMDEYDIEARKSMKKEVPREQIIRDIAFHIRGGGDDDLSKISAELKKDKLAPLSYTEKKEIKRIVDIKGIMAEDLGYKDYDEYREDMWEAGHEV